MYMYTHVYTLYNIMNLLYKDCSKEFITVYIICYIYIYILTLLFIICTYIYIYNIYIYKTCIHIHYITHV